MVVALHCFLCPNFNLVPSSRYLGVFEDIENISSYDWSGFVLRWMLDGVKSFTKGNKEGQKCLATLRGCMFYLAISVCYMLSIVLSYLFIHVNLPLFTLFSSFCFYFLIFYYFLLGYVLESC